MGRRRVFGQTEETRLLEEARQWRARCVGVLSRAPVGGPVYKAASGILDAIDGLAGAVTGDRSHFHLRAPTTPGPHLPDQLGSAVISADV